MDIYHDHIEAKAKLGFWKKKELEIRNEILEEMAGEKDEGAVSKTEGNLKITATFKMNRSIDVAVLDNIYDELTEEEKSAVKFKPEVVIKIFRDLEEKGESALLDAVTLKPGQGSLVIKEI